VYMAVSFVGLAVVFAGSTRTSGDTVGANKMMGDTEGVTVVGGDTEGAIVNADVGENVTGDNEGTLDIGDAVDSSTGVGVFWLIKHSTWRFPSVDTPVNGNCNPLAYPPSV